MRYSRHKCRSTASHFLPQPLPLFAPEPRGELAPWATETYKDPFSSLIVPLRPQPEAEAAAHHTGTNAFATDWFEATLNALRVAGPCGMVIDNTNHATSCAGLCYVAAEGGTQTSNCRAGTIRRRFGTGSYPSGWRNLSKDTHGAYRVQAVAPTLNLAYPTRAAWTVAPAL
jgi:hypothetical protein